MKFQQVSNHNFYSNIIWPQYFLIFVTVTEILKDVFKKLKEIPEENKTLHAKIDELNAAVRLIIGVWLIFNDWKITVFQENDRLKWRVRAYNQELTDELNMAEVNLEMSSAQESRLWKMGVLKADSVVLNSTW